MSSNWLDFYQTNFSDQGRNDTTPTAAAAANSSRSGNLSPDQGRISKPVRRRPRASQRSPITLLNADPTNFRAMVQRFTGGHDAAFTAPTSQLPINNNSFDFNQGIAGNVAGVGADLPGGYPVRYYPTPNQRQEQEMFMTINNNNMHGDGMSFYAAPGNENQYYYARGQ